MFLINVYISRVEKLAEECRDLRGSMGTYLQKKHKRAREEEQRADLFSGARSRKVLTQKCP